MAIPKSCSQNTNTPPSTLAEFTLAASGEDNYDISLVDGFNVPLNIYVSNSACPRPTCMGNINPLCPPMLRTGLDKHGVNLGCLAACNAGFGAEKYGNRACCTGSYNDPNVCAICGVDYYNLFKDNCNMSYAYAYDEKSKSALWTCPSGGSKADYTIEFCPSGTDYVGARVPGSQYLDATASCTSRATSGPETFTVPPSPSTTISMGTLNVVATVATGLDGAAAFQIDPIEKDKPSPTEASTGVPITKELPTITTSHVAPATTSSLTAPTSSVHSFPSIEDPDVKLVMKVVTETHTKTVLADPSPVQAIGLPKGHGAFHGGQWLMPHKRPSKRRG